MEGQLEYLASGFILLEVNEEGVVQIDHLQYAVHMFLPSPDHNGANRGLSWDEGFPDISRLGILSSGFPL